MIKRIVIMVMLLVCFVLSSCSFTKDDVLGETAKESTDSVFKEIELNIPELDQNTHVMHCTNIGTYLENGSFRLLGEYNLNEITYYDSLDNGQTWEKKNYKIESINVPSNYFLMSLNFSTDGTIVSSGYEIFPELCEAKGLYNASYSAILYENCGVFIMDLFNESENQFVNVNLPYNSDFGDRKNSLSNVQYHEGMVYGVTELDNILVEIDPDSGNITREIFSSNGASWGGRYYLLGDVIVVDRIYGYEFYNRITGAKYNCPEDIQRKLGTRENFKAIFTRGFSKEEIIFIGIDGIYRYNLSQNMIEQIISANESLLADSDRDIVQLFAVNEYEYYVISIKNDQVDMHCFKYESDLTLSNEETNEKNEIAVDIVIKDNDKLETNTDETELNSNTINFVEKELPSPLSYTIYLPQNWIENGTYLGEGQFRLFNSAYENQITYYESFDYGQTWELITYEPGTIDNPMDYWTTSTYFAPDGTIVTTGYEVFLDATDLEMDSSLNNRIYIGDAVYEHILEIRNNDQIRYVSLNLPKIPDYNYGMDFLHNVQYCNGLIYGVTDANRILVEVDPNTGEVTKEIFKSNHWSKEYFVLGDIIGVDGVWGYEFYNRLTGEIYDCPEDVHSLMGRREGNKAVFTRGFSDEEIIFVGIDGIYRYDFGKNMAEQVISDEYNTLSKEEYNVKQLYAINEEEYFIVGIKNDDNSYIHRFVYDG